MQRTDDAHSATGALTSSTNIIQFPSARARRRPDRSERPKRLPRSGWPSRSGRRTPELLIALAICKAITLDQRQAVLSFIELDHAIIGDDCGRDALGLVGAIA